MRLGRALYRVGRGFETAPVHTEIGVISLESLCRGFETAPVHTEIGVISLESL